MNCFPCFQKKESSNTNNENIPVAEVRDFTSPPPPVNVNKHHSPSASLSADPISKAEAYVGEDGNGNSSAKTFTFRELAMATKTFRQECLLGEGGFGRVFKGTLQSSGQIVAVRQLDRSGTLGSKEFLTEVSMLSLLQHPNLIKIIGYCADGDQRLLVYEYMPSGSLSNHLFDIPVNKKPLDWSTRMKIAAGIAEGLEYLHEKANPPIIYRDLKSSNILLDETNNPRLSEYGLAKLMQSGDKMHVSPRVMAGYGYCAPEYEMHGELTLKSDVYSFGVVLLELITGRRAMDTTRPINEQNLVSWAQPIFSDPKRFPDMADPHLKKKFAVTSLNQAVGVAAMCLQDEPMVRPLIADIVAALSFLALASPEAPIPDRLVSILSGRVSTSSQQGIRCSLDLSNISHRKKECTSDNEHEHKKNHSSKVKDFGKEDDESSESEYENSSTSSDDEDGRKVKDSGKRASRPKRGSDSKRKSMRSISRSNSSRRSSIGSRDFNRGFSVRNENSIKNSHDYSSDSSSDEESLRKSVASSCSRRRSHDGSERMHSRSNREEISMRSDDDDDDDDGSELEYSRNSSGSSVSNS